MARIRPALALAMATVVLALVGAGIWAMSTGASSATAAKPRASRATTHPVQSARQSGKTTAPVSATTVHTAPAPSTVAAVFDGSTDHSCSAGVIASTTHDLLITAAHCVSGTGTGLTVTPGYDAGQAPYGTWSVTAVFVDPAWAEDQSEDDDFAILRVAPQTVGGETRLLQDVTGAVPLGMTPTGRKVVTVQGFNAGSGDQSVACTTELAFKRGNPVFRCDGYTGGSSGSPWLVTGADHVTRTIGVIGGRHQGGCKQQRSFSSAFGADVMTLLSRAERAGTEGDNAPTAPPPAACTQTSTG